MSPGGLLETRWAYVGTNEKRAEFWRALIIAEQNFGGH